MQVFFFLTLEMMVAADLHFMNHQGPQFQLNVSFTVLLKKKVTCILDDLIVSKLTANFHVWMNYPFIL